MKISLLKILSSFHLSITKLYDRILMHLYRSQFSSCGKHVHFYPTKSEIYYKTIEIGDNVYIGPGAMFLASDSSIIIGNNVLFGPKVSIIGGNHSTHIMGKFMANYKVADKLTSDDESVIIENDVWIGTGVIILKGVHVARGSIVAAGAVVNKDVPPYAIVAGVPAKVVRYRWGIEDILKHERLLYPIGKRLTVEQLVQNI